MEAQANCQKVSEPAANRALEMVNVGLYGQLAALALFYVVFSITYVKLNLYYLNPMFIFRSYRTYTLVSEGGEEYVALVKHPSIPTVGETIQYRRRDHILLISSD